DAAVGRLGAPESELGRVFSGTGRAQSLRRLLVPARARPGRAPGALGELQGVRPARAHRRVHAGTGPAARAPPERAQGSTGDAGLMLYVIKGTDGPQSLERRRAARAEHLARLEALQREGRLLLAGPLPAIDAEDPGPAG